MAFSRISVLVLSLVFVLFALSDAKEVVVGGKHISWTVDSSKDLSKWAEKKRFRIGDLLRWNLDKDSDSVVQVTKDAYDSCDTSNPIKANVTEIKLEQAGPLYFVTGDKDHCDKGLKLSIVVMSDHKHAPLPADFPSPAPSTAAGPAASPPSNNAAGGRGFSFSAAGFVGIAGLVGMALI